MSTFDVALRDPGTGTFDVALASSAIPATGLRGWWAADDLTYSDNDPVTSWASRVGSIVLEEATNPPTFKTSILNSLPAVRFSTTGTDQLIADCIGRVDVPQ